MTTYPACKKCDRPMRGSRQTETDHPGTVAHHGRGHCRTCNKHAPMDVDPQAVARTASELAGYLKWRRPYREGAAA